VGIISANRPEWVVLAFAAYGRNARYIPMYEKELVGTWKYIIPKLSDFVFGSELLALLLAINLAAGPAIQKKTIYKLILFCIV
jgi:long-subunit acyl-CoA synthetase (AMP-forming)